MSYNKQSRWLQLPRWRLRHPHPMNALSYYHCDLLGMDRKAIGYLLADARLGQESEVSLLEKIISSTQRPTNGIKKEQFSFNAINDRVIILLGSQVTDYFLATLPGLSKAEQAHVICSRYSLAELLEDPGKKAETWRDIKKAIQLMKTL